MGEGEGDLLPPRTRYWKPLGTLVNSYEWSNINPWCYHKSQGWMNCQSKDGGKKEDDNI